MKVTIEHNGKKVDVELTAEQVKELGLQEEKKTGWERDEEVYYYMSSYMQLGEEMDVKALIDNYRYSGGNYFSNKTLAEKMLKRVRLMLRMQRWADEHNEPLDWSDGDTVKYRINYNTVTYEFWVDHNTTVNSIGAVYFSSDVIAREAIREFGDEIIDCYVESEVTR